MKDSAEKLKDKYGSLAKLANKCGMDRTTIYRVLNGTYTGDIAPHIEKINAQLNADHLDFQLDLESLSRLTIPRNIVSRVEALKGTVQTITNHCPEHTRELLQLVVFELEDIYQLCNN
ncbi:hypothetical protein HG263_05355 [Pseudoalteromonas sp. JBTF-M23]|uniref:Uncharacterized protein n=1 Tax=Pseudoalteromonas caenipelagi TaxID=2726988 RepID=A0A849V9E4_9GAMM|nr:hypothetical protein [Pseudoalteromonas caenipelagi]NOU49962.1 hypothetical protein [Pseudoalteromonas caenipelagi]